MHRILNSQFLYNPDGRVSFCHAPSIAETASGTLVAAWYAYEEEECREAVLVIAHKPSGEEIWSKSRPLFEGFQHSCGNPVLFEDTRTSKLWILFVLLKGEYWTDAQMMGSYSTDLGQTWSRPAVMWRELGMMVRHPPLELRQGEFLLPAYDERTRRSVLLSSRPPTQSWDESHRFEGLEVIQPALLRESDRELSIFFRPTRDPRVIWRARSADEGASWSDPVRTNLPNPLTGISAFALGKGIAVINNHTRLHQRHPLSAVVSFDQGVTWSEPWHLETSTLETSYPSFLCDRQGVVHGLYTYNRRMIKYVSFKMEELQ